VKRGVVELELLERVAQVGKSSPSIGNSPENTIGLGSR
jgi:hypothetical protein